MDEEIVAIHVFSHRNTGIMLSFPGPLSSYLNKIVFNYRDSLQRDCKIQIKTKFHRDILVIQGDKPATAMETIPPTWELLLYLTSDQPTPI